MLRFHRTLLIALLATVGSACAHGRNAFRPADGAAANGSVTLAVNNNNFADVDVYVVSEGLATRLGTVTGNSKDTFRLDPSFFPAGDLRIVATPIGGNGRASSGPLNVAGGQTIVFNIAPVLRQSSASIR